MNVFVYCTFRIQANYYSKSLLLYWCHYTSWNGLVLLEFTFWQKEGTYRLLFVSAHAASAKPFSVGILKRCWSLQLCPPAGVFHRQNSWTFMTNDSQCCYPLCAKTVLFIQKENIQHERWTLFYHFVANFLSGPHGCFVCFVLCKSIKVAFTAGNESWHHIMNNTLTMCFYQWLCSQCVHLYLMVLFNVILSLFFVTLDAIIKVLTGDSAFF